MKFFIIKYNFFDIVFLFLTILIVFSSLFYILDFSKIYLLVAFFLSSFLVLYSFFTTENHDNSIIAIDGVINFNNIIKNKCDITVLFNEFKKRKFSILHSNTCVILKDNKFTYYYKKNDNSKVIPLILNGNVLEEELYAVSKNYSWLINNLNKKACNISDIKLAIYFDSIIYIIKK